MESLTGQINFILDITSVAQLGHLVPGGKLLQWPPQQKLRTLQKDTNF